MSKMKVASGHTLKFVRARCEDFAAAGLQYYGAPNAPSSEYTSTYTVHDWCAEGPVWLYTARHESGQWHVWYRNRAMYSGFGLTRKEAIERAVAHGWLELS